ncbi:transcription antitermination factor NusB [Patescibacteria group bacterium]|nr:transcription antitermination factor NusB [Patescibacteria group bacterium]
MLDRHLLRSITLQSLFEWDIRKDEKEKEDIQDILKKNLKDFAQTEKVPPFVEKMINCIFNKLHDLDNIISQAAPQWPIDKIPVVDRNILRIGICELLFSDRGEVPPKVAINEAIELAKAFGGENSSKFISGVMGTIYKELGEPQKHETSESRKKQIDTENLPTHYLAGVMIYAKNEDRYEVMMAHNIFGYWTLLKGKDEEGMTAKENIIVKTKRKTGLDIKLQDKIGGNEYVAFHTENGHIKKKLDYYLAESDYQELHLEEDSKEKKGIDEIKWLKLDEIEKLELYDDMKDVIKEGIKTLKAKK